MSPAERPLVAFVTDFGSRDPYVAAMKLVTASRCSADLVDLGHDLEPFDIFGAAFFLKFALEGVLQPPASRDIVVVCVVDPGVGSARRILAARRGRVTILTPDNGVASLVIEKSWEIRSVENESMFLPEGSVTFHGRDRFAPVAAALADGAPFESVGPPVSEMARIEYEPPQKIDGGVRGTIIAVDRYGNAITDLPARFEELAGSQLRVRGEQIRRASRTYSEGPAEPFLIIGSRGTIEVSLREGNAAARLGLERGERVEWRR